MMVMKRVNNRHRSLVVHFSFLFDESQIFFYQHVAGFHFSVDGGTSDVFPPEFFPL